MLILGHKYQFTSLEKERLYKKFKKITNVLYKDKKLENVLIEIEDILHKDSYSVIVLNTKDKVSNEIISFLTNLKFQKEYQHITIISMEHFLEKYLFKCYISENHTDLHYLDDIKPYTTLEYIQKRMLDFVGIFFLYTFAFFVMQKCKRKIKEESPNGPVYFKQKRVGKNKKEFVCIKFRSMDINAEEDGVKFASKDDPRIFPWGAYMRQRRYDELPQLFNVLKGEMHLIGPRPERKYWTEQFEKKIPYYNERHIVAPGITGWAQVMYPYGSSLEDARQKLMYDLYYIKHWNLWLEIKVVWKTAWVVINKKGL